MGKGRLRGRAESAEEEEEEGQAPRGSAEALGLLRRNHGQTLLQWNHRQYFSDTTAVLEDKFFSEVSNLKDK